VLDPIDLALSKVERNAEVDRRDVIALARAGWLDVATFRRRYAEEVAPYLLAHHARHDDTAESFARLIDTSTPDPAGRQ
jgi:G:T-mismatch repair DNA endonuclease (very short patch repair protein)